MTWSMGGVLTLLLENVLRWVHYLIYFNSSNFYFYLFIYFNCCMLWNMKLIPSLCCVAGPWEDRSCWFSVDCSSKYSLTRESGNLFSMIILVRLFCSYCNSKMLIRLFIYFLCFGRDKQNLGKHHGMGYVNASFIQFSLIT